MSVIDERFLGLSPTDRVALQHVRETVLTIAPNAEEVITYNMPGFKYRGKYLVAFESFKDHLSLFPGAAISMFTNELKDFKTSKGTIQFTVEKPLPDEVLRSIIRYRVQEIDGTHKTNP